MQVSWLKPLVVKDAVPGFTLREAVDNIEKLSEQSQIILKETLMEFVYSHVESMQFECSDGVDELLGTQTVFAVDEFDLILHSYRSKLKDRFRSLGIDGFKTTIGVDKLITWCYENVPDRIPEICSEYKVISLNPLYKKTSRKLYYYLHRKFDNEDVYDEDSGDYFTIPAGAKYELAMVIGGETSLNLVFPDDEVTKLLNKYNANRCVKINKKQINNRSDNI